MNSNLKAMDQQTNMLIEKMRTGIIVRWAHMGLSDYMLDSINFINYDIHLFEELNEKYEEKTNREQILEKVFPVLNDLKNSLLLKTIDREVIELINNYLILVNNWNRMNENNTEIDLGIQTTLRIIETMDTLEGLLQRAMFINEILAERAEQVQRDGMNNSITFKTSSTYLQAVKDSLKARDKKLELYEAQQEEQKEQQNVAE